jgi:hypothetical protein
VLDRLDADGILVDAQDACLFTRRRADAAGEIRKIVGRVQRLDGGFPVLAVDQVVPVGNDVVDWAPAHAERNAAIHAARALPLGLLVGERRDELAIVLLARFLGLVGLFDALELEKSGYFSHRFPTELLFVRPVAGSGRHRRSGRKGP